MKVIVMTDEQYEERFSDAVEESGAVEMMVDRPEGEFRIQYTNDTKSILLHHGTIEVGHSHGKLKYGGNEVLPTYEGDLKPSEETFNDILRGLKEKYSEMLLNISPSRVNIIIDYDWEPKSSTHNSSWKAKIKKYSEELQKAKDKDYEIVLHWYFVKHLHRTQIIALIMSQLLQIDKDKGTVKKLFVDDENPVTSTWGTDVFNPRKPMRDIIAKPLTDDEWKTGEHQLSLYKELQENKEEPTEEPEGQPEENQEEE